MLQQGLIRMNRTVRGWSHQSMLRTVHRIHIAKIINMVGGASVRRAAINIQQTNLRQSIHEWQHDASAATKCKMRRTLCHAGLVCARAMLQNWSWAAAARCSHSPAAQIKLLNRGSLLAE